jgi:outer membrane protein OmpA-like peptidoglycan-associated protein
VFDALVANEPIEAAALQRLSRFRAQALVDALAAQGVAPERLALAPVAPVDADAQRSARAWLSLQVL